METLTPPQVAELDKRLEPALTPEEAAAQAEAEEAAAQERLAREWETWGESEAQLAEQRRFMAMAGPEG